MAPAAQSLACTPKKAPMPVQRAPSTIESGATGSDSSNYPCPPVTVKLSSRNPCHGLPVTPASRPKECFLCECLIALSRYLIARAVPRRPSLQALGNYAERDPPHRERQTPSPNARGE